MKGLEELRIFDPKKYEEIKEEEYEVKIIGEIELSENEMKVLKLHPKSAILPRLFEGGLDLDEELANSKIRMQLSKELEEKKEKDKTEEYKELEIEKTEKSEEDRLTEIEMESKTRQVFDPVGQVYDERKRRVTDLRECNRITLPKPLPEIMEAKIEVRRDFQKDIFENYRRENCSNSGEQASNLSRDEKEGLKTLEKKIKERKIIVIKTDKSSRFAVCSEEAYIRMGKIHTTKDKIITREVLEDLEKQLNTHCVAWGKIFNSGDNHDHRGRIINSKKTVSENTADLYILYKDHKPGEKTRPIVTGCSSNTLGMSNNTASVIEAVAASEKTPFESISSEDMLAKTKKCNKNILEERERRERGCFCKDKIQDIQNPEDLVDQEPTMAGEIDNEEICKDCGKEKMEPEKERCLIGCDVVALFPSLTSKRTGEIVRDRIMKSGLKFEGINYKQ